MENSRNLCKNHLGDLEDKRKTILQKLTIGKISNGLIVAGLQKLGTISRQSDLSMRAKKISLIVFDEAHQSVTRYIPTPVDTMTLNKLQASGFDCHPGRTWNDISADEELSKLYHRNKGFPLGRRIRFTHGLPYGKWVFV